MSWGFFFVTCLHGARLRGYDSGYRTEAMNSQMGAKLLSPLAELFAHHSPSHMIFTFNVDRSKSYWPYLPWQNTSDTYLPLIALNVVYLWSAASQGLEPYSYYAQ